MSIQRRARPRSRRCAIHLTHDSDDFSVWLPPPDDPLVIAGFGDAASLALELTDWPASNEILVLLDERRRVTAMLVDPPPAVGLLIGEIDLPALEVPFCQTLSIVVAPTVFDTLFDGSVVDGLRSDGPPPARHRDGYFALRRFHMLQGLQLLDVILAHPERVQSLAIACDPDPIWFEDFDPDAFAITDEPEHESDGPAG